MLAILALWATVASAAEYFLETAPLPERPAAQKVQDVAKAAGFESRVVRRFRLGKGWAFVVLVERFDDEAEARDAAARLARDVGVDVVVFQVEDSRAVALEAPAPPPADERSSVGELLARAQAAHGGVGGGARALGRAPAVHFVFTRTLEVDGKPATIRHDYWRDGAGRRLVVETGGAGTDSVAVATAAGAWVKAGSTVATRDVGVLIGTLDAYAPEAVLTLALDVASLLEAPEVERFRALEGAESGTRVGQGGDESEPGLSFLDLDPKTGKLIRARYVTEAGPVTVEMEGWREVAPGVIVPGKVRIERADGRREAVAVERLEVAERAPAGLFDRPGP